MVMAIKVAGADVVNGVEITKADNSRAADPGNGAGPANTDVAKVYGQNNCGKRTHAQFNNAGNERNNRAAQSLKRVAVDEYLTEEKVKQNADVQVGPGLGGHVVAAVFDEDINQFFAQCENDDCHCQAEAERNHRTIKDAAANAAD